MKFKIGDVIDFGFYVNTKVIGMGLTYYILEDKNGNNKCVGIDLVDKYGKKADS